jgi:hypothetical protein
VLRAAGRDSAQPAKQQRRRDAVAVDTTTRRPFSTRPHPLDLLSHLNGRPPAACPPAPHGPQQPPSYRLGRQPPPDRPGHPSLGQRLVRREQPADSDAFLSSSSGEDTFKQQQQQQTDAPAICTEQQQQQQSAGLLCPERRRS